MGQIQSKEFEPRPRISGWTHPRGYENPPDGNFGNYRGARPSPATGVAVLLENFTIPHDSFRQTPDCWTHAVDAKLGNNRMDITMVAGHFPQDLPHRGTLTVNIKMLRSCKLFLFQKEHPLRRTNITLDPETFKKNHRERTVIEAMLTRQYHDPQLMKT